MKKWLIGILLLLTLFFVPKVSAQNAVDEYVITAFDSSILIERDTTLSVTETIHVNFPYEKHGIYRNIPYVYTAHGKTIRAELEVDSVTDENRKPYTYTVSKANGSVQIKIGDPNYTISGQHVYNIIYKVSDVLQRYDDHDELYWNVTGHEWDTDIASASAVVTSPFAQITKIDCFSGLFKSQEKECTSNLYENNAQFTTNSTVGGNDRDFTVVLGLAKESRLMFPGKVEQTANTITDNWGYIISIAPFLLFGFIWLKRGRDKKYAGENVYYKPDNSKVVTKPLFYREHLPMVYSPIQGLSPAEIGTIIDQKVDVNDVVAEITELARLGYIQIDRLEKDKFIGKDVDYVFIKLKEDTMPLNDYQEYLAESLFSESYGEKSIAKLTKIIKKDDAKLKRYLKLANEGKLVTLSVLKNEFYSKLNSFKEKLYKDMAEKGYFDGSPDKVRAKWIAIFAVISVGCFILLNAYRDAYANPWPFIVWVILEVPTFIFAYAMPRRLAWGYSLYRQIEGLAYFLKKGEWREKIAEKQLFFEEMLPIAISLRIVDKLAKDMKVLGLQPPSYFNGFVAGSFASDLHSFESTANGMATNPRSGSAGTWSGGSGFSGGSSGGGFGGGGGGSW